MLLISKNAVTLRSGIVHAVCSDSAVKPKDGVVIIYLSEESKLDALGDLQDAVRAHIKAVQKEEKELSEYLEALTEVYRKEQPN